MNDINSNINNKYIINILLNIKNINCNTYVNSTKLINKINLNVYNLESNYIINGNLLNNYIALNFEPYSNNKINILSNKNNGNNENNENNIYQYIDLIIYLYKINKIDYSKFENNCEINIINNKSKYQTIIFINDLNCNNALKIINNSIKLNKKNINNQINIIEFNNTPNKNINILKKKYNYIFINTDYINQKYKYNRSFAYNIMKNIFEKYLFEYEYYIFNDIIYNIIINKEDFNNIGNFDPELFYDNSNYEIYYFFKKMNKICDDYLDNNVLFQYESYYTNIINIYQTIKDYVDFFIKNRNNIDYNIVNNKISVYLINLENRKDRLNECIIQFNKIGIYNYNYFKGIIPEYEYISNCTLMNPNKLWKKNNIEYLISSLGCKLSHLEVLKKGLDSTHEYIMILEDDVNFENNTIIYLNLAFMQLSNIDWDILYLSVNLKNKDDAEKVDFNLLKIKKGLTTTGQIFQKKHLKRIIELIENSDCEIDNTYNDMLINKYSVYPMCVYQRESYSDINKKVMDYGDFHRKYIY
jgi:GR25 family glycosyltransferase involved in LPS biosynthesis